MGLTSGPSGGTGLAVRAPTSHTAGGGGGREQSIGADPAIEIRPLPALEGLTTGDPMRFDV
jgi:hypothetical protein